MDRLPPPALAAVSAAALVLVLAFFVQQFGVAFPRIVPVVVAVVAVSAGAAGLASFTHGRRRA